MKQYLLLMMVGGIALFLDQLTKWGIQQWLSMGQSVSILSPLLSFTLTTNTGAAFSILQGQNVFLAIISVLVLGLVGWIWYREKNPTVFDTVLFGVLIGGILGNLVDRIIHGGVIDFIDLHVWPIFNLADSFLCVSIGILVLRNWKS